MTRPRGRIARDDGTITLLTLGFVMLGLLLIVVVVDASAVFMARKGLLADCDAVALRAAQSLDIEALYANGADKNLPQDDEAVSEVIATAGGQVGASAYSTFWGSTDGTTIEVHGVRFVVMPFLPRLQAEFIKPVQVKADCSTAANRR